MCALLLLPRSSLGLGCGRHSVLAVFDDDVRPAATVRSEGAVEVMGVGGEVVRASASPVGQRMGRLDGRCRSV